jgi:glycosyltransferase involved in cell wall biosynthesis
MEMKKVSILIPVYNSESFITDTIKSALNQSWQNKEIIVVDDGSSDGSLEIARSFENKILKVYTQDNKGVCAARNFALTKATGEYIQFLDHDDILDVDKIEYQMNFITSNELSETDVVYCAYENFYDNVFKTIPNNVSHKDKSYTQPLELFNDMLIARTIILPASYLMHRCLIECSGGWNESLLNNEDGEFYARVMNLTSRVFFVPKVKIYWRTTENSLSKRVSQTYLGYKYKAWTSIIELLLKNNNSERTQYACMQLLTDFIVEFRPENSIWLKPIEQFMNTNNLYIDLDGKSDRHKWLIRNIGWRRTLLLKEWIKRMNFWSKRFL